MKNQNIDMVSGSLMKKMMVYTIPIILTGVLQLLYNAADLVVVGQFASEAAFSAVGATGSLNALFINLFIGLSTGGCICVAQYYGARKAEDVSETVHTSVVVSVLAGLFVAVFGCIFVEPALKAMGTPDEIIGMSALYLKLIFIAAPSTLFYNFAAGILRATGDTKRPFLILVFTGAVNVILNLILVIGFGLDVLGVALATVAGNVLNSIIIAILLLRTNDCIRIEWKKLVIKTDKLIKVLHYGIPSGIQSLLFSCSNVIVQSAVNSFNSVAVIGGNAAASGIEGFMYISLNSVSGTALNFSGQNFGARKYKRIDRTMLNAFIMAGVIAFGFASVILSFSNPLLRIYQPNSAEAVYVGTIRLKIIVSTYFICAIYEIVMQTLRAIGCSWTPTVVALFTIAGLRITWIYTVFYKYHTLEILYMSWPITWIITFIILFTYYQISKKKYFAKNEDQYNT